MWQRIAAAVLCACFMAPLCRPLLTPDPEAALPPCCRRNGKHHCAKMARYLALKEKLGDGKPDFGSAPEPCPYRSALFAPIAPQPLGSPPSLAFYAAIESHPAILSFAEVRARVSQSRSHYKRGPPALL